jgi:hypothetical protein
MMKEIRVLYYRYSFYYPYLYYWKMITILILVFLFWGI